MNDSTIAALNKEIIKSELQEETVNNLNENIKKASTLIPTNLKTEGVIVRRSGKQVVNDRASRVDDMKICFTLPENSLAPKGVNKLYIQVINPQNNVMGALKTVDFETQTLKYSKAVEYIYTGAELDICEVIGADVEKIIPGVYRINIYNGPIRVGNSEISFR